MQLKSMYSFLVLTAPRHWLVIKAHPYHCSLNLPLSKYLLHPKCPGWSWGSIAWPPKQPLPVYHQPVLLLPLVFIIHWKNDSIWDSQTHVFWLITASLALRYIWVLQHLPAGISLKELVLCVSLRAPGWGGSRLEGRWRIKVNTHSQRCLPPSVSFSHLS